ncbi:MAG: hypothetical protein ACREHF_04495 [Rhizomicrobium sp.]
MGDLTKPLPHVVTGLIEKRREIAGRIEDLQRQMRQAVCDLDHVEASIRLFKPDIDLDEIMPRPVPPPHAAFKGEVTRIILDTLRRTTRPLTTRDLTLVLMRERGLRTDDAKLVRLMQQRVVATLGHWKRRGYLKSSPANDVKGTLLWEIADDPVTDAAYDPETMRVQRLPGNG